MEEREAAITEAEKNLNELEAIGEEITNLEKKLEAIPGNGQSDLSKYNRKQRRRIERQMIRNEKEKQRKAEQQGNTFVTRREFVGLFQSAQKLRDRLYYVDVLTAAMEKLLLEKNIITQNELEAKVKEETERALAFQEIQKGVKDYENRLKKCVELQIDPNASIIGQQLYEDSEVDLEEKLRLAKEFDLKILLKILGEKTDQVQNTN